MSAQITPSRSRHRKQEAGNEHTTMSAHSPDRRAEEDGDRNHEDRMPEVLRGEERVGDGEEQERSEEKGVAHSFPRRLIGRSAVARLQKSGDCCARVCCSFIGYDDGDSQTRAREVMTFA